MLHEFAPPLFGFIILPLFPIIAWATAAVGGVLVCWYNSMSPKQADAANKMATQLAVQLFNKSVDLLSSDQMGTVMNEVRRRIGA